MSHKSQKIAAIIRSLEGGAFDAHYLGFFECFNQQLFFEAHDVLEEIWLQQRGQQNDLFYKGLIQFAGAFVHIQKRRPQQVMLHAIPSALARNKELVEVYQRYWNRLVSPGEAVFALRDAGEEAMNHARKYKLLPPSPVQEKEIFL